MTREQQMAMLAKCVYRGAFPPVYNVIYRGEVGNTQFAILTLGREVIAVFAGSNQLKDWCMNALVRRRNNVHRGFLTDYEQTAPKLYAILNDMHRDCLVCVGHSYGGGIANIMALDMAKGQCYDHQEIYTFGCPRVGNKQFSRELNGYVSLHRRYANRYDIVARVPFGFGYKHAGHPVKFSTGRHGMDDYLANMGVVRPK